MYMGANFNMVSEACYAYFCSSIEQVCEKKICVEKKNLAPWFEQG